MPLLGDQQLLASARTRATVRVKTAGTKLSTDELVALEKHCRERNITPGELIRRLIFAELERGKTENDASEPALTEILGVRLLLVNVLRPLAAGHKVTPETFDKLLGEIGKAKYELAGKLASERRR